MEAWGAPGAENRGLGHLPVLVSSMVADSDAVLAGGEHAKLSGSEFEYALGSAAVHHELHRLLSLLEL